MGLIFNGNGDVIRAVDGSLTVEGIDLGGSTNINAGIGTFSGNLNVGGVLTYEDVKNVDSVGVVTARSGVYIPADDKYLKIGASNDLSLVHTSGSSYITNSTGHLVRRSDVHKWENYDGSSEYARFTSTGLGIGIVAPTRNLHIDGTAHQSGIIIHTAGNHSTAIDMDSNRSSAAGGLAELNFKWNGTAVGQIGAYAGADTTNKDDGHIHFGTASAGSIVERLRITSGGQTLFTGVSGTTPLDIKTSNSSNNTVQPIIEAYADNATYKARIGLVREGTSGLLGWAFLTNAVGSPTERLRIHADGEVEIKPSVAGQTTLSVQALWANASRVHIATFGRNGNDVKSAITYNHGTNIIEFGTTTNHATSLVTNNIERIRILNDGKVGIGKLGANRRLHVASDDDLTTFTGGSYGTFAIENSQWDNGDYTAMDFLYNGTNAPVSRIASKITSSGASLHFGVSNNYSTGITHEAMVIDYVGKVGINTTTPDTQLEVFGGSTSIQVGNQSGLGRFGADGTSTKIGSHSNHHLDLFTNGVANTRLRITSNGAVGIGTVTPDAACDNRPGLHIHSNHNDSCRLNLTTPTNDNTRIGYFGLNRFGIDACYGFQIRDSKDSYATRLLIDSTGKMGLGTTPSEQFHLLKSHNGHTRMVVQNNWGANATAQLKLVSPTDEFQLIKYASGSAAINLSNNSTIITNIGGATRVKVRGDSTGQTTHIVNTPSPGGNGVPSQYVTQPYAMSGNYSNFRVTVTVTSWHSFFLKIYISGYSGHSAHRWVSAYCNNGFGTVRTVLSNDSGNFGSGTLTHISGQQWRYDLNMNSGTCTHPVMLVELAVGGNGNVLGNGAVVCAIS